MPDSETPTSAVDLKVKASDSVNRDVALKLDVHRVSYEQKETNEPAEADEDEAQADDLGKVRVFFKLYNYMFY